MTAIFESRAIADQATEKLKVFAQPQRLMILSCLLGGEFSVSDIDAATAIGQPALSQQLAALRRADIVSTRREGKQVLYALADDNARLCVRTLEALFAEGTDAENLAHAIKHPVLAGNQKTSSPGAAGFAKIL